MRDALAAMGSTSAFAKKLPLALPPVHPAGTGVVVLTLTAGSVTTGAAGLSPAPPPQAVSTVAPTARARAATVRRSGVT